MLKSPFLKALAVSAVLVACSATPTTDPPFSYTLTVAVPPVYSGGTVVQDPLPGPDGKYLSGTIVQLKASPSGREECSPQPYLSFAGWSGDIQGSTPATEITMDSDKSVTAGFKEFFPPPCPPTPTCKDPTLEISLKGETLQFDQDRLQVAAGTEVVLCFSNVSNFGQHNWVLVQDGTKNDVAWRGMAAGPDNDWVQPGDADVAAHTKLVDPGVSGEARFTAPSSGTYQFVCTVPGHNFTMFGDFIVTP